MQLSLTRLRIAVVLLFIAAAILLQNSIRPERGDTQQRFDGWLASREKELVDLSQHMSRANGKPSPHPAATASLPVLTMKVSDPEGKGNWGVSLGPSAWPAQSANILRILQLMKESDVFTFAEHSAQEAAANVSISVKDGNNEFNASFAEKDAGQNLKVLTLLRLFKEYADRMPSGIPGNA